MALKRKFDYDAESVDMPMNMKQPKLIPFPNAEPDTDVVMSDAPTYNLEPLLIPIQPFHTRLPSNASYSSSSSSGSPQNSPFYPSFDLYPHDDPGYVGNQNPFDAPVHEAPKPVGLLQPRSASFTHHGQNCSQIPKLRVACSPGLNGQRTIHPLPHVTLFDLASLSAADTTSASGYKVPLPVPDFASFDSVHRLAGLHRQLFAHLMFSATSSVSLYFPRRQSSLSHPLLHCVRLDFLTMVSGLVGGVMALRVCRNIAYSSKNILKILALDTHPTPRRHSSWSSLSSI
ncbi:uncharacterized protein FIBRA_07925 [Fibroporia radiculosa]|uniref:Uncharacterized protein n=1 Tax=Fibroporia radiculosa TaxID=599839 RepID=J4H4W4_9APHY|nr:uncharacterized protein FIBRA_07925 [Fibroporia radiculosa]CCM05694.1 predicted protein [Fibroporia radiculosa]